MVCIIQKLKMLPSFQNLHKSAQERTLDVCVPAECEMVERVLTLSPFSVMGSDLLFLGWFRRMRAVFVVPFSCGLWLLASLSYKHANTNPYSLSPCLSTLFLHLLYCKLSGSLPAEAALAVPELNTRGKVCVSMEAWPKTV